jgi:ABC-type uncharacterized transport system substrate-binding protein
MGVPVVRRRLITGLIKAARNLARQVRALGVRTPPISAFEKRATRTIPIVFALVPDAIGAGYLDSLARLLI